MYMPPWLGSGADRCTFPAKDMFGESLVTGQDRQWVDYQTWSPNQTRYCKNRSARVLTHTQESSRAQWPKPFEEELLRATPLVPD